MKFKPFITAIIFSALSAAADAEEISPEIKKGIIDRCRAQMNSYGAAMVKACVDQDMQALKALRSYPKKYQPIIDRCIIQMSDYGQAMVKACADQDIEAEKALSQY